MDCLNTIDSLSNSVVNCCAAEPRNNSREKPHEFPLVDRAEFIVYMSFGGSIFFLQFVFPT